MTDPMDELVDELARAADFPPARLISIDDIMGPGEIRAIAGDVSRKTLSRWRERPDFPKPIRTLDIGDLFDRQAVVAWLEHGR